MQIFTYFKIAVYKINESPYITVYSRKQLVLGGGKLHFGVEKEHEEKEKMHRET